MSDIVERLRAYADEWNEPETSLAPVREAADEIVRLRAERDEARGDFRDCYADLGEMTVKFIAAEAERDRLRDALKDALVSVLGQRDYKADRECATRIAAALKGDT